MLYTPAYIELKGERLRWYPRGIKRIPADVSFDPLALAYWFCGDGTYDKHGAIFFCTNGFLKKEVNVLAQGLVELGSSANSDIRPFTRVPCRYYAEGCRL